MSIFFQYYYMKTCKCKLTDSLIVLQHWSELFAHELKRYGMPILCVEKMKKLSIT